ncbi:hypothetical protein CCUS01_02350, partial [Colletotrichum cuscutae]
IGSRYNTIPNVGGWTIASVVKLGTRAAGFGAAAGVAALFYTSGIPRIQNDILVKIPIVGPKFLKEVPPASDNVSFPQDRIPPRQHANIRQTAILNAFHDLAMLF